MKFRSYFSDWMGCISAVRCGARSSKTSVASNDDHSISKQSDEPHKATHSEGTSLDSYLKTMKPLVVIPYEHFTQEYRNVATQDSYDGMRIEKSKTITPYLNANYSLFLGTSLHEKGQLFQFGPTFALGDESLMMMARYGNDGTMTLRARKRLAQSLDSSLTVSSSLVDNDRNMFEAGIDMYKNNYCISSKLAWQGTLVTSMEMSQRISKYLHCGCRLTWLTASGATLGSIGFRHMYKNHLFSCSVTRQPNFKSMTGLTENMHVANLLYFRQISDRLSMGTELEVSKDITQTSSALRFVYEYTFRHARVQGSMTADGCASMTALTASGIGVSANVDFLRGVYKFGLMMRMISSPPQESS